MELKVWVGGIQRTVCGVTSETTCQDVIMALAHATGQTGRFVLLEQWKEHEKYLLPGDKPLEILEKWGEYSSGVRFILRKSGSITMKNNSNSEQADEVEELKEIRRTPNVRSPGSGSSLPSPQNSIRRGQKTMSEFTARIVENGTVEDLVKFIELQKERLQLLREEADLLDSEEASVSRSAELEELKQQEQILNKQIEDLAQYDLPGDDIQAHFVSIHPKLVQDLKDEKEKINNLDVKIMEENLKLESLTKELNESREEEKKMEQLEKEKTEELEKLRLELANANDSLAKTEAKLSEVAGELGHCVDQVRLREGVLQDLKLVLKSSSTS